MAHDIDLLQASIYVGTYKKYNEGSLFGKWLDLEQFSDKEEFYNACSKLHQDEDDPEYMFQDHEHIPESLISESWISDKFFSIRDALGQLKDTEKEAFHIWCNNYHHDLVTCDIDDMISSFRDEYKGEYESEEAFAREVINEQYQLDEFSLRYFDYKSYASDLFCGDYWSQSGHVFINS